MQIVHKIGMIRILDLKRNTLHNPQCTQDASLVWFEFSEPEKLEPAYAPVRHEVSKCGRCPKLSCICVAESGEMCLVLFES